MAIVSIQKEDILTFPMQTIVIPVNTVGAMGAGLAYPFKEQYPEYFVKYFEDCRKGRLKVGNSIVYPLTPIGKKEKHQVLFFPTKKHWMHDSTLDIIEAGLKDLCSRYKQMGIKSLAVPMLGCGKGNQDGEVVMRLLKKYLDPLDIPVKICLRHY